MTNPSGENLPANTPDDLVPDEEFGPEEQRLVQFVLHAVQQNLQINTSLQMPIADLERLKALDEGAFQLYLRRFEAQHASDIFIAEAPHRLPHHLARTARPYALIAIAMLCAVAGYLAYLGHTGKSLAALVAICVPMALAFLGTNGSTTQEEPQDPDLDEQDQPSS